MSQTVMSMRWAGVTPEQYEEAREVINWEGDVPDGAVLHVAGFDGDDLRVTDVWESEEDFNTFVERFGPFPARVLRVLPDLGPQRRRPAGVQFDQAAQRHRADLRAQPGPAVGRVTRR